MTEKAIRKSEDLLDIIDMLIDVASKENDALENHDVKKVEELSSDKKKFVNLYQEAVKGFAENTKWLKEIDEDLKTELKQASLELDEVMKENTMLLSSNINANKRLVDTIVGEVKKSQSQEAGVYKADGSMSDGSGSNPAKNSLNLNKTL